MAKHETHTHTERKQQIDTPTVQVPSTKFPFTRGLGLVWLEYGRRHRKITGMNTHIVFAFLLFPLAIPPLLRPQAD